VALLGMKFNFSGHPEPESCISFVAVLCLMFLYYVTAKYDKSDHTQRSKCNRIFWGGRGSRSMFGTQMPPPVVPPQKEFGYDE